MSESAYQRAAARGCAPLRLAAGSGLLAGCRADCRCDSDARPLNLKLSKPSIVGPRFRVRHSLTFPYRDPAHRGPGLGPNPAEGPVRGPLVCMHSTGSESFVGLSPPPGTASSRRAGSIWQGSWAGPHSSDRDGTGSARIPSRTSRPRRLARGPWCGARADSDADHRQSFKEYR